jgi:hypothetical protein
VTWQLVVVLALALTMPVVCGVVSACAPSMQTISALATFVAGGVIGLAQANVKAKRAAKAKDAAA